LLPVFVLEVVPVIVRISWPRKRVSPWRSSESYLRMRDRRRSSWAATQRSLLL